MAKQAKLTIEKDFQISKIDKRIDVYKRQVQFNGKM